MCACFDDKATNHHPQNVSKDLASTTHLQNEPQSIKPMTFRHIPRRTMFLGKMEFCFTFYVLLSLQMVNIARYRFSNEECLNRFFVRSNVD